VSGNNGALQASHPLPAVSDVSRRAEDDLSLGSEADQNELREVRFVDLVRARQTSPLPLRARGAQPTARRVGIPRCWSVWPPR